MKATNQKQSYIKIKLIILTPVVLEPQTSQQSNKKTNITSYRPAALVLRTKLWT